MKRDADACGGNLTGTWSAGGAVCATVLLGDAPDPATITINGDQTLVFNADGTFASKVNGQTYVVTVPNSHFKASASLDAGTGVAFTCADLNAPSIRSCVSSADACVCTSKLEGLVAQGSYSADGGRVQRPSTSSSTIESSYCVKDGTLELMTWLGLPAIVQYERQ